MKVRVERGALVDVVARAAMVLPRVTAIDPLYAALRLTANHEGLQIAGFDGMAYTRHQVAAEVLEDDAMLLPGHAFVQVVGALQGENVELSDDPHGLSITSDTGHYIVRDLNHLKPPALPMMPAASGTIAADLLTRAVRQVAPSTDLNNPLAVLAAIQVVAQGRQLVLRASDRHRFAVAAQEWAPNDPRIDTSVICPVRHLVDAVRAVATGGDVTLCFPQGKGPQFGLIGNGSASLRTVDEDYIRFGALASLEYLATVEVDAAELRGAVERLRRLDKESERICLEFTVDQMIVSTHQREEASAFGRQVLDACLEGPERARLVVKPGFLVDGLAPIDGRVQLHLGHWNKAVLLQGADDVDATYRNWIQPLRDPWADPKNWA